MGEATMIDTKQYTFIDLFAGVGGFHLGLSSVGKGDGANTGRCVYACEWDKNARKTYLENFTSITNFDGDITRVDPQFIPDHDILAAGFPCQPFSIAGEQRGFSHETQGNLFFNIETIINAKRPKVVFLENVKNLVSHDRGRTFQIIRSRLEGAGYDVYFKVLNSSTHGNVPQNRERIFIVGVLPELGVINFEFPEEIPLTLDIGDVLHSSKVDDKYYCNPDRSQALRKIVDGCEKEGTIYQYRRYYIRENKRGVCPTLTANMGAGGHNVPFIRDKWGVRKLTPRECFNLQGFPSDFKLPKIGDSSLYKQAGNAVTVPVIRALASKIYEVLDKAS
jgi:DNA (cytosine-5)-methyltransferase 1